MTAGPGKPVSRPGDWVTYDDGDHQVVALAGTSVRLRSVTGAESVVLVSHLMAAPDFAVTGTEPLPVLAPSGLLATLPEPSVDGRPVPFGTWDNWDDRIELLIPFDREKQDYINYSTSRMFAAVYPEAVALAPVIASPHWRQLGRSVCVSHEGA